MADGTARDLRLSQSRRGGCLEEADDVAVVVDVHLEVCGCRPEAGHRSHLAEEWVDEAGADAGPHLADWHREPGRGTLQRRVVADREMRLGDADRQVPEPGLLELPDLALGQR